MESSLSDTFQYVNSYEENYYISGEKLLTSLCLLSKCSNLLYFKIISWTQAGETDWQMLAPSNDYTFHSKAD